MEACLDAFEEMGNRRMAVEQWAAEARMIGGIWESNRRLLSSRVARLERLWEHVELTSAAEMAKCLRMRAIWASVPKRWEARTAQR